MIGKDLFNSTKLYLLKHEYAFVSNYFWTLWCLHPTGICSGAIALTHSISRIKRMDWGFRFD
ncbi:MAG: hypothetical protein WAT88_04675, partial [Saprospiraceae bacterium]